MKRISLKIDVDNPEKFFHNALHWSKQFNEILYLNSNNYYYLNTPYSYNSYGKLLAVGSYANISLINSSFESLKTFIDTYNDWVFGHFGYDLKNQIENLFSSNIDFIKFPDIYFFIPRYLFILKNNQITINYTENENINDIRRIINEIINNNVNVEVKDYGLCRFIPRVSEKEYYDNINKIKSHIYHGDIYEMNYCIEFYSPDTKIDPYLSYENLNKISPAPFSCFYKLGTHYLMCSSMERFIKKIGHKIISQPIKGTIERFGDVDIDNKNAIKLANDIKERSENIMIVDIVRNDLSHTALKGSVEVEELCGVYPFNHVFQMISTISSKMDNKYHIVDVIKNAFPMGSMTGAPKIRAMELIEQYEITKRGIFSGSVGYFSPENDFDFNVVIRSLIYNEEDKYLNFMVGSAITANSVAEREYNECLLKAKGMIECFY